MENFILQEIPLFSSLPPEELSNIANVTHQREIPADTILFHEGDHSDYFAIILQGEVDVIKSLDTSDERLVAVEKQGSFLGEMSLLYPDQLRTASVRTRSDVLLLEMTSDEFYDMIHRMPELALKIMQEIIVRFHNDDSATIRVLQEKNQQLSKAYEELQAAQAQLIEKEKMEHELRMARQIQEDTLPRELPDVPGWNISACWKPARSVSGDFYDFLPLNGGKLGIVVGDVTGKGVPAALVMATTKSVLRAVALQLNSPSEILERANNLLFEEVSERMFVTCLYIVLDPENGNLQIANAGHNLPQLCMRGDIQELKAKGMPLGLLPGSDYIETSSRMSEGDFLLMYSDGLVEAHSPDGEMYGFPRLSRKLKEFSHESSNPGAEKMIELLLDDLESFTGTEQEAEDDVTFIALERNGGKKL